MKYGVDVFLLELNDETSRKYCRSGKKKTGMNSLDKRLSLFKSPEVKAKIAIS